MNSFVTLRHLFIMRLAADTFIILPIIIIYKLSSATYSYNYIIVLIILVISELVIILKNLKNLYSKTIIENIEQI